MFLEYKGMLLVLIRILLLSTHNIPFSMLKKKKTTQYYPKSAAMGFFKGTQE